MQVYSEIGRLRKVLLHRPGKEIENLTPDLMDRLLFDDVPYLEVAQKEHNAFAEILKNQAVEVLYLEDLVAETLLDEDIKDQFLDEFLSETSLTSKNKIFHIKQYLLKCETKDMVDKMMAGIRKEDISDYEESCLADMVEGDYPFAVDPMPNLYFTRDPFSVMGHGIALNHMRTVTRNRETIFGKYIFKYHPQYKQETIPLFFERDEDCSLEGGDILILNDTVVAVGISERTDPISVEKLAKSLFAKNSGFEVVLAFDIPKKRSFMHLDTVFTQVDINKFVIHPEIEGILSVFSLTRSMEDDSTLNIKKERMELKTILEKYLRLDNVILIRCGGSSSIDAAREQWSDASNTLAIAPGEVLVYSRNKMTNQILKESGVRIHVMPSSELSRGRGGPRYFK